MTTYHNFRCFDAGPSFTHERYTIIPPRSLASRYFYKKSRKWCSLICNKFGHSFFEEIDYSHHSSLGKRVIFTSLPNMVQNAIKRAFPEDEWKTIKNK
jgi:hypothetical protein